MKFQNGLIKGVSEKEQKIAAPNQYILKDRKRRSMIPGRNISKGESRGRDSR